MTEDTSDTISGDRDVVRTNIIVYGEVQEVGFRSIVRRIAVKQGLKGFVQNLPDLTVLIVAEGRRETMEQFVESIRVHNGMINVERICVEFSESTGEFEWFTVKFGDLGEEMFQGFSTAKRYLDNLGGKIDQFRDESNANFQRLDDKYHVVSEDLHGMHGEMKSMHGEMKSMRGDMHGMRSDMKSVKTDIKAIRHAVEST